MDDQTDQPAAAADDAGASLDPTSVDPRELMRMLLPAARREYIRAWEWLADANTPLDRRRAGRARATRIAEDHAIVAAALRERERALTGDDLLNARHLAGELERHASALERLATLSPLGLQGSSELRPEALGCGRRYRDPARAEESTAATRGGASKQQRPRTGERDSRDRGRGSKRAPGARDPKPPRDALGTSKHESPLGEGMDEDTRAKLEELRRQLES